MKQFFTIILVLIILGLLIILIDFYVMGINKSSMQETHILTSSQNTNFKSTFQKNKIKCYFDLNSDDFAEATSWVNKEDFIIAYDTNENNHIDGANELFTTKDSIKFLNTKIKENNNRLILWQDINLDCQAQEDEYRSIKVIKIEEDSLVLNSGLNLPLKLQKVEFDDINTRYRKKYDFDIRVLFLPTLRGYGRIPDLHTAMSLDKELLQQVQNLASQKPYSILTGYNNLDPKIVNILYSWAKIERSSFNKPTMWPQILWPQNLNKNIDKYKFVVKYLAQENKKFSLIEHYNHYTTYKLVWKNIVKNLKSQLVFQLGGKILFNSNSSYKNKGELVIRGEVQEQNLKDILGNCNLQNNELEGIKQFVSDVKHLTTKEKYLFKNVCRNTND